MFGRLVAGLVVVGLAVGVWVLWPRDTDTETTSIPEAISTTSTAVVESTATTTPETTTTTEEGVDIIETVAEAEEVLRNFWFGWFEGIYNQDEDRIKEVVASQAELDSAIAAFTAMTFDEPPTLEGIDLHDVEILRSDESCAAIWAVLTVSFREGESSGVHVFRATAEGWKSVSTWILKDDLWEQDCETQLEPLS